MSVNVKVGAVLKKKAGVEGSKTRNKVHSDTLVLERTGFQD